MKSVTSTSEFLSRVLESTHNAEKNSMKQLWYRGESNSEFLAPLSPSFYRPLLESIKTKKNLTITSHQKLVESNLRSEFQRRALPFIVSKGIKNTSWNRYFLMQHYKVPTRLLDWTQDALTALFFSVSDQTNMDKNSYVWILEPFKLNEFTIKNILNSSDKYGEMVPGPINHSKPKKLVSKDGLLRISELSRRYLEMDFKNETGSNLSSSYYPLAVYPSYLDERMVAQKSCFTIFGNLINGFSNLNGDLNSIISKIEISGGQAKRNINKELQLLGIDHSTVYPDLDGLGITLSKEFESEIFDNSDIIFEQFLKNG